jgi:hypothetical protein
VTRTVVVLKTTGEQLGNQLLPYMSVFAYCVARGHRLVYLPFERYLGEFARMEAVPRGALRRRALYRWYRALQTSGLVGKTRRYGAPDTEVDGVAGTTFVRLPPSAGGVEAVGGRYEFVLGWRFANPAGVAAHRCAVRREFAPSSRHAAGISSFVGSLPADRPVVGVHVRTGDYRGHSGGALFVEPGEYAAAMGAVRDRLLARGDGEPRFVVFSDEPVGRGAFGGFDTVVSGGSMMEDLFRMAHCPLVIGTSSTFNLCAAWYGGGCVWHLRRRLKRLTDPAGVDPEIVLDADAAVAAIGGRQGAFEIGLG